MNRLPGALKRVTADSGISRRVLNYGRAIDISARIGVLAISISGMARVWTYPGVLGHSGGRLEISHRLQGRSVCK